MGGSNSNASTQEIKDGITNETIYIIDVRQPGELGADQRAVIRAKKWLNIPVGEFDQALSLSDDDFKAKYGLGKPESDGSNLVINCASGNRSSRALSIAHKKGYSKAKHYPGGYGKWQSESP